MYVPSGEDYEFVARGATWRTEGYEYGAVEVSDGQEEGGCKRKPGHLALRDARGLGKAPRCLVARHHS